MSVNVTPNPPEFGGNIRNPFLRALYNTTNQHRLMAFKLLKDPFAVTNKKNVAAYMQDTLEIKNIWVQGPHDTEPKLLRNVSIPYSMYQSNATGEFAEPSWVKRLREKLLLDSGGTPDPHVAYRELADAQNRASLKGLYDIPREATRAGASMGELGYQIEQQSGGRLAHYTISGKIQTGAGLLPQKSKEAIMEGRAATVFDRLNPEFQAQITILQIKTISGTEAMRIGYHNLQGNALYKDNDGDLDRLHVFEDRETGKLFVYAEQWPSKGFPNIGRALTAKGFALPLAEINFKSHEQHVADELAYYSSLSAKQLFSPTGRWHKPLVSTDKSAYSKWSGTTFAKGSDLYPTAASVWEGIEEGVGGSSLGIGPTTIKLNEAAKYHAKKEFEKLDSKTKRYLDGNLVAANSFFNKKYMEYITQKAEDVLEREHLANRQGNKIQTQAMREVELLNQFRESTEDLLVMGKFTQGKISEEGALGVWRIIFGSGEGSLDSFVAATAGSNILKGEFTTKLPKKRPGITINPIEVDKQEFSFFDLMTNPIYEDETTKTPFARWELHNLAIASNFEDPGYRGQLPAKLAFIQRTSQGTMIGAGGLPEVEGHIRANILPPVIHASTKAEDIGKPILMDAWAAFKEEADRIFASIKVEGRRFGTKADRDTVEYLLSDSGRSYLARLIAPSNISVEKARAELSNNLNPGDLISRWRLTYDLSEHSTEYAQGLQQVQKLLGVVSKEADLDISLNRDRLFAGLGTQERLANLVLVDSRRTGGFDGVLESMQSMQNWAVDNLGRPIFGAMNDWSPKFNGRYSMSHLAVSYNPISRNFVPFREPSAKKLSQNINNISFPMRVAVFSHIPPSLQEAAAYSDVAGMVNAHGQRVFKQKHMLAQGSFWLTAGGQDTYRDTLEETRTAPQIGLVQSPETPFPFIDPETGDLKWYGRGNAAINDPLPKITIGGITAQPNTGRFRLFQSGTGEEIQGFTTIETLLESKEGGDVLLAHLIAQGVSPDNAIKMIQSNSPELLKYFAESSFYGHVDSSVTEELEESALKRVMGLKGILMTMPARVSTLGTELAPGSVLSGEESRHMGRFLGSASLVEKALFAQTIGEATYGRSDALGGLSGINPNSGNPYALEYVSELGESLSKGYVAEHLKGLLGESPEQRIGAVLQTLAEGVMVKSENSAKIAGFAEFAAKHFMRF